MTLRRLDPDRRPLVSGARYTDGSPVVFGPFGGDDLTPVERRLRAFAQAHRARPRWRRLLGLGLDPASYAAIDARYPLPARD